MGNKSIISSFSVLVILTACHQAEEAKTVISSLDKAKISGAVSCTATGLPVQDSVLYMSGGGAEFQPTEFGNLKSPAKPEKGMARRLPV